MNLKETIEQIAALGKIKYIAWHITEDVDCITGDSTKVRVEDEAGKVLEIPLHHPYSNELSKAAFGQDQLICVLLLAKCYCTNGIDEQDYFINAYNDLFGVINQARKKLPYTGKQWVNEERARLYDHVAPEYIR